jgi:hypothetical protein
MAEKQKQEVETKDAETEKIKETDEAKGSETESEQEEGSKTKQPDVDPKIKQQIDQERANAKRAREALDAERAEKEQLAEQVAGLQSQLGAVQNQLKEQLTTKEYKDLANLDPDATEVPDLVRAHQALTQKAAILETRAQKAEQYILDQQQRERAAEELRRRDAQSEEIYADCDDEFGAQYRNAAIKLADQKVQDGEVELPRTVVQGARLMRHCYKEVSEGAKPKEDKKKSSVPTDTGLRGLSVTDIQESKEFKPGSLDEVAKDMASKMKTGKWNKAFAGSP